MPVLSEPSYQCDYYPHQLIFLPVNVGGIETVIKALVRGQPCLRFIARDTLDEAGSVQPELRHRSG